MDGVSDEIAPEELNALLDAGESVRIVDIRSAAAFERGHIPGSENVPFADLPQRVEEFADATHIVTVCPHGKASLQAVRLLDSAAATDEARVKSLDGGLDAWDGDLEPAEYAPTNDIPSETVGDASDAPF